MTLIYHDIEIPISEHDLDEFRELLITGESFSWTFNTEDDANTFVNVKFVVEDHDD